MKPFGNISVFEKGFQLPGIQSPNMTLTGGITLKHIRRAMNHLFQQSGGTAIYEDTSLTRNSADLGPYSRAMPRTLWCSWGGGLFLMGEVPLSSITP